MDKVEFDFSYSRGIVVMELQVADQLLCFLLVLLLKLVAVRVVGHLVPWVTGCDKLEVDVAAEVGVDGDHAYARRVQFGQGRLGFECGSGFLVRDAGRIV